MGTPEDKSKEFGNLSGDYDPTRSFGWDSSQVDNPLRLRVERFIKKGGSRK